MLAITFTIPFIMACRHTQPLVLLDRALNGPQMNQGAKILPKVSVVSTQSYVALYNTSLQQ